MIEDFLEWICMNWLLLCSLVYIVIQNIRIESLASKVEMDDKLHRMRVHELETEICKRDFRWERDLHEKLEKLELKIMG